jgi:hypothetical protein
MHDHWPVGGQSTDDAAMALQEAQSLLASLLEQNRTAAPDDVQLVKKREWSSRLVATGDWINRDLVHVREQIAALEEKAASLEEKKADNLLKQEEAVCDIKAILRKQGEQSEPVPAPVAAAKEPDLWVLDDEEKAAILLARTTRANLIAQQRMAAAAASMQRADEAAEAAYQKALVTFEQQKAELDKAKRYSEAAEATLNESKGKEEKATAADTHKAANEAYQKMLASGYGKTPPSREGNRLAQY